ncbi:hypothetical protein A33M_3921 [Rhodovulum sp. PH10]|uniref:hypothetical protein n=1 Tax=Rhodovulum sp. PH10 TaxID=1187851 RepID=UPI00027C206E|nr:hypothetical protein [Rhodovulum sp. PH10]EJW10852.1 hypothetical protein A33M_3921 [Rhodovulum sp. PH10]
MSVLLLSDDGRAVGRICEASFIDEGTVREHRVLYERHGRAGVERLAYQGGSGPLRRDQIVTLEAFVDETAPPTACEVCAFVAGRFGVHYGPNALSKLLKPLASYSRSRKASRPRPTRRCSGVSWRTF